jgi:hypothetical protein
MLLSSTTRTSPTSCLSTPLSLVAQAQWELLAKGSDALMTQQVFQEAMLAALGFQDSSDHIRSVFKCFDLRGERGSVCMCVWMWTCASV